MATLLRILVALAVLNWVPSLTAPAAWSDTAGRGTQASDTASPAELYFEVEALNDGLETLEDPPDLRTPRASLEHFLTAARARRFSLAARSLNLNMVPPSRQADRAADLAQKLSYVLMQEIRLRFSSVPDRPDGQIDADHDEKHSLAGQPRRSIKLVDFPVDVWDVEIRIERFKPLQGEALWLFSPRTVEKIETLYETYGPGPLLNLLPFSIKVHVLSQALYWQWGMLMALGVLAAFSGWAVQRAGLAWDRRQEATTRTRLLISEIRRPLAFAFALLIFYLLTYTLVSPPGNAVRAIRPLISILIIGALTLVGIGVIDFLSSTASRTYQGKVASEHENEARRRLTRISIARHVLVFLAVSIGLGIALLQLNVFQTLSLSFLASAGVASVVLGVAAHSVLGNMLAGVQIALTQPVRIGDSVSFEGQWGYIERISYAYITIRTWDARRVVVPLSYFVSHPFENWSMTSAHVIKPIYLYADHHADVEAIRGKFHALLHASDEWDRSVEPVLEVTGMSRDTIELRALCSAGDPTTAWKLHCRLREQLIHFLEHEADGRYLPRHRVAVESDGRASDVGEEPGRVQADPSGLPASPTRSSRHEASQSPRQSSPPESHPPDA